MKAVVKLRRGDGNVEYRAMPEPFPESNEVKVKVEYTGICGTDIHVYHDSFQYTPPVIMGHEFTGTVVEVGSKVTNFKIGDRVTAEAPARICGTCDYCQTGDYNLCSDRVGLGWGKNGSFANYCCVEESRTHHLPENINFKLGTLCEPLACVTHGVLELTNVSPDNLVIVSGPGPIGLLTLQVAKSTGARVIVCGVTADKKRLDIALKLGADQVIDVLTENVKELISNMSNGYGADVAFECSGVEASAKQCIELLKKGGQYTQVGLFGKEISLDFDKVTTKELKVTGVQSQKRSAWKKALQLLERNFIDLNPLISAELPLREWKKGIELIAQKEGLKVVLYPEK